MLNRWMKTACGVLIVTAFGMSMQRVIADPPATVPAVTGPATTSASVTITWDQAAAHVGETVTATGPVIGTHVTTGGSALILNIGKDFPDPTRLSIMIKTDPNNPVSPDTYQDKTVTVTGKIELYRKAAEIKTTPADVIIVQPASSQKI
jgi:hypothetical protein